MSRSSFTVQINERQMLALQAKLAGVPRGADRAASRAINRTTATVRKRIIRNLQRELNAPQKAFRGSVPPITGARRATMNRLQSTITVRGKRIPLKFFAARQRAKGVVAKIKRGGQSKLYRSAFFATMPSGHTGVFRRKVHARHRRVKKGGRVRWHALPIFELFGPSPWQYFDLHLAADAGRDARQLLAKNLDAQVRFLLRR
jgi:hypothetical protein